MTGFINVELGLIFFLIFNYWFNMLVFINANFNYLLFTESVIFHNFMEFNLHMIFVVQRPQF